MLGKNISVSILDADFSQLRDTLDALIAVGPFMLHYDVIDGYFAPELSFGKPVIRSIESRWKIPSEVHLMVRDPAPFIRSFYDIEGVETIYFHLESSGSVPENIKMIKSGGKLAGIAINPETEASAIENYLGQISSVLVLLVKPGKGGQEMDERALKKVSALNEMRGKLKFSILVDGGIKLNNLKEVIMSGPDRLVIGSAIMKSGNPPAALRDFLDYKNTSL